LALGLGLSVSAFDAIDTSGDGFLSEAELIAAGAEAPGAGCQCGSGKALFRHMYGDLLVLASAFMALLAMGRLQSRP
jgi:hypothetical protein